MNQTPDIRTGDPGQGHQKPGWFCAAPILAIVWVCFAPSSVIAARATVTWEQNEGELIAFYKVFYHEVEATPEIVFTPDNSLVVSNLVVGRTYRFYLTAIGLTGLESLPSDEVIYTVPPRLTVTPAPDTDGSISIGVEGLPAREYAIQTTTALGGGEWQTIARNIADSAGHLRYQDTEPATARFYRLVQLD